MDHRDGAFVLGLGFTLVGASLADGELLHGYGMGLSAFLLHLGLLYALVGVAAVSVGDRRPVLAAVGAHVAFFVLACGLMYYDLVVAPPEYGMVPTATGLIANRAELAFALLPVSVGYLAGALSGAGRWRRETPMLVVVAAAGPAVGSAIALARGSAPGFTQVVFALLGLGAFVGGGLLYVVARRGAPEL